MMWTEFFTYNAVFFVAGREGGIAVLRGNLLRSSVASCMPGLVIGVVCFLGSLLSCTVVQAEDGRISVPPPAGMTLADVVFVETVSNPVAVLVLCPGANGDGGSMIRRKEWRDFARKEKLGLAGIHFQSPAELLRECGGYYCAGEGSGGVLLAAVEKCYGKGVPLLLFGFSGGAHFITRFVAWKPGRVIAWAALGAGVLDTPSGAGEKTHGLMACGSEDPRLGGALVFFKQGRAAGNPWLWMCLPGIGHASTEDFEAFSRQYFASCLHDVCGMNTGVWVDIDRAVEVGKEEAARWPSLSGWLPDRSLLAQWRAGHEKWGDYAQE